MDVDTLRIAFWIGFIVVFGAIGAIAAYIVSTATWSGRRWADRMRLRRH